VKIIGAALVFCLVSAAPSLAQNNTGYPSGTKCQDLQSQRRTACNNAFDPRPNPGEIINQPPQKPLLPPKPRALGQPVPNLNPKNPVTLPPPSLQ
jgi:hypothetical protein